MPKFHWIINVIRCWYNRSSRLTHVERRSTEIWVTECSTSISGRVAAIAPIHGRACCKQMTAETNVPIKRRKTKQKEIMFYLLFKLTTSRLSTTTATCALPVLRTSLANICLWCYVCIGKVVDVCMQVLWDGIPVGVCNWYLFIILRTINISSPVRSVGYWLSPAGIGVARNCFSALYKLSAKKVSYNPSLDSKPERYVACYKCIIRFIFPKGSISYLQCNLY